MSSVEIDTVMYDLINAKPLAATVREFLGLLNCLNSWIKQIHFQKSLIAASFSTRAWRFDALRERVLRLETCIRRIMDVSAQ